MQSNCNRVKVVGIKLFIALLPDVLIKVSRYYFFFDKTSAGKFSIINNAIVFVPILFYTFFHKKQFVQLHFI